MTCTYTPPPSANKATRSGLEETSPEVQNRGLTKRTYVLQKFYFLKKGPLNDNTFWHNSFPERVRESVDNLSRKPAKLRMHATINGTSGVSPLRPLLTIKITANEINFARDQKIVRLRTLRRGFKLSCIDAFREGGKLDEELSHPFQLTIHIG